MPAKSKGIRYRDLTRTSVRVDERQANGEYHECAERDGRYGNATSNAAAVAEKRIAGQGPKRASHNRKRRTPRWRQ